MKHRNVQAIDAGQKGRPGIRIRRGIFAVLAVTVALSSCGGDDSEESDNSSSPSSTAVAANLEAMLLTATDIDTALGGFGCECHFMHFYPAAWLRPCESRQGKYHQALR